MIFIKGLGSETHRAALVTNLWASSSSEGSERATYRQCDNGNHVQVATRA
jgi:hypothetical protein